MTREKKNVLSIEKWSLTQVITLCYILKSHLQILMLLYFKKSQPQPFKLGWEYYLLSLSLTPYFLIFSGFEADG
jgi:hypothetical protein